MQAIIEYLRELNFASTVLRMALAMFCGGMIGLEREQKGRPAGFRTYMLVCLGAATTMLLGQYEYVMLNTRWAETAALVGVTTDVSRFGAQVINGIGFLGAGTIIVTGRQEVKGLTTSAGLWASACMGLAIGAGFYECMIVGFLLILVSVKFFPMIEEYVLARSRNMNVYIQFDSVENIGEIVAKIKSTGTTIYDIEMQGGASVLPIKPSAVIYLHLPHGKPHTQILALLSEFKCVRVINEI